MKETTSPTTTGVIALNPTLREVIAQCAKIALYRDEARFIQMAERVTTEDKKTYGYVNGQYSVTKVTPGLKLDEPAPDSVYLCTFQDAWCDVSYSWEKSAPELPVRLRSQSVQECCGGYVVRDSYSIGD